MLRYFHARWKAACWIGSLGIHGMAAAGAWLLPLLPAAASRDEESYPATCIMVRTILPGPAPCKRPSPRPALGEERLEDITLPPGELPIDSPREIVPPPPPRDPLPPDTEEARGFPGTPKRTVHRSPAKEYPAAAEIIPPRPDARNVPPRYPRIARIRGWEGRVVLRAWISPEGRCMRVTVAVSSGYRVLDEAALEAVKRWTFSPGRHGGRTVAATIEIPVRFRIKG